MMYNDFYYIVNIYLKIKIVYMGVIISLFVMIQGYQLL